MKAYLTKENLVKAVQVVYNAPTHPPDLEENLVGEFAGWFGGDALARQYHLSHPNKGPASDLEF